jgi:tRNA(Arg) A34 adenosine deaminase TadA
VLLTGIPVFHAEITAIIDASLRLNPKALLGSDYYAGTILEMIPRPQGSPDPVPERARMLKGCEIYINGAPCPMCMSAIYWARIDTVYFGGSLEDTSKIGFNDAFQYEDFKLSWEQRKNIKVVPNFEREVCLLRHERSRELAERQQAQGVQRDDEPRADPVDAGPGRRRRMQPPSQGSVRPGHEVPAQQGGADGVGHEQGQPERHALP